MNKKFYVCIMFVSVMIVFTSCLGTNDENVYYNDTAITAFTLGTLDRTAHTTSYTGGDSTYSTTVTGSNYKMYIDQVNRKIYNLDSLPYGTDIKHVLVTITTKNGGVAAIKNVKSDTLSYYSSSDSIDFTTPRTFFVYSNDGTAYCKYVASVGAHKEEADSFHWDSLSVSSELAALKSMKAVYCNGRIFVMGDNGDGHQMIYSTGEKDGNTWKLFTPNFNGLIQSDASLVTDNSKLYLLNNMELMTSTDGDEWNVVASTNMKKLVGVGAAEMYALNADNKLAVSKDNGVTWNVDPTADDATFLPTQDISCVSKNSITNSKTYRITLIGNRSVADYPADTTAVVWSKLVEYSEGAQSEAWTYQDFAPDNLYLPYRQYNFTATKYGDGIVALGGKGIGACTKTAFNHLYYSEDGGITWHNDTNIKLPTKFSSSATSFALTSDSGNYLWIICGSTGQVWRGRQHKVGWSDNNKVVTQ
jgi:hypothetical protein